MPVDVNGIMMNTAADNGGGLFSGLSPDNLLKSAQLRQLNAFRDGAPTDASGNIDWGKVDKRLLEVGAYSQIPGLSQIGLAQQQQRDANTMMGGMMRWLAPDAGSAGSDTPSAPASTPPVSYYRGAMDKPQSSSSISPNDASSFLLSVGATPNEARALPAFAASESNLDPNAVHDNGSGFGLFGHRGDRLAAMQEMFGTKTPDAKQQLLFALQELRSRPEGQLVDAAKSPEDLAIAQMHFERPKGYTPDNPQGGLNYAGRLATQRRFWGLGQGGGKVADAGVSAPSAPQAPAGVGPMAYTSTGQPVQTDAQGRSLDPNTGLPVPPARNARAIQTAQDETFDADAPGDAHPMGPQGSAMVPGQAGGPNPSPAGPGGMVAGPGAPSGAPMPGATSQMAGLGAPPVAPNQVAGPGAPSVSSSQRQAPIPTTVTQPPPLSKNAGQLVDLADPSLGGQVPRAWLAAGHSAGDWIRYSRTMAGLASGNQFLKGFAEQWGKIADGAAQTLDKQAAFTNEMKNYALAQRQGYAGSFVDFHNEMEAQKSQGAAQGKLNVESNPAFIRNLGQQEQARAAGKLQGEFSPDATAARAADAAAVAESKGTGEDLGKLPQRLADTASSARAQNNTIDEMIDAADRFRLGAGADWQYKLNRTVSGLGHAFNVDVSNFDEKTAGYESAVKLGGQIARQAVKDTGSNRAGVQELRYVASVMPNAEMSPDGFHTIATQLKGLNDFNIAKQQAADVFASKNNGSLRDFEASWNGAISPAAFVLHRMQIDQPKMFAETVSRMKATPQGKAVLANAQKGLAWGDKIGIFE